MRLVLQISRKIEPDLEQDAWTLKDGLGIAWPCDDSSQRRHVSGFEYVRHCIRKWEAEHEVQLKVSR